MFIKSACAGILRNGCWVSIFLEAMIVVYQLGQSSLENIGSVFEIGKSGKEVQNVPVDFIQRFLPSSNEESLNNKIMKTKQKSLFLN